MPHAPWLRTLGWTYRVVTSAENVLPVACLSLIHIYFNEEQYGILSRLSAARAALAPVMRYMPEEADIENRLESAYLELTRIYDPHTSCNDIILRKHTIEKHRPNSCHAVFQHHLCLLYTSRCV